MPKQTTVKMLKAIAGILILGSWMWASNSFDLPSTVSLDIVRGMIESMGPYGSLAFIGLCIAAVMLHMPEILVIAAGSVVFGGIKGFVLGWIGCMAGLTISFTIARYFLKDAFRDIVASRSQRLISWDEKLERHGFVTVLYLRLILFMVPPLNWAIAVTRVRFRDYLLGSAIGIVPCAAIVCYAGNTIAKATSFSAVLTPEILLPLGLAVAFVAIGASAARRFFR